MLAHSTRLTLLFSVTTFIAVALVAAFTIQTRQASGFAHLVFITHLDCDSNPEVIRITSSEGSTISLTGFLLQSDPSQEYTLSDYQSSIAPGETIEFQSGSNAADGPGIYKLTGASILRNGDSTDYARLIRPGTSDHQVNCGSASATPTPSPSPAPTQPSTQTPQPTATETSTATPEPTPFAPQKKWGDWNCSGQADPVDSLLTLRYDAGLGTNTGDECPSLGDIIQVAVAGSVGRTWGDVDCSGAVDPIDALKLLRFDAGLSVTLGSDCPTIGSDI
ncbi:MAG TPA: hypothetical protein VMR52_05485 [Dehalococcoidia bacterium]|nr:hypothetical protein [Dehalococcoidia bacterium]